MDMTSYRELNTTTSTRPANGSNGTQGVAIRELNAYVKQEAGFIPALLAEVNKVMVGQEALVTRVLIALLADGHVLLEGVPGLAKTLLEKQTYPDQNLRTYDDTAWTMGLASDVDVCTIADDVVRPRLGSVAHSRATAAFLEVLTSMAPDNLAPPTIRRCCGREFPRVTNSRSKASPMRASISSDKFWWPCSIRATAL